MDEWAAGHAEALAHFGEARLTIPNADRKQFELAIRWFFSAQREFEIGRPLVKAALSWVCLESQAKYLNMKGKKLDTVRTLLQQQGFPKIPRLKDLCALRNDAFREGTLSKLRETDAQLARTAGRNLVRAEILHMIGTAQSDFRPEFVAAYA